MIKNKVECNGCEWGGFIGDAVLGHSINLHRQFKGLEEIKMKFKGDTGKFFCPECYQPIRFKRKRQECTLL